MKEYLSELVQRSPTPMQAPNTMREHLQTRNLAKGEVGLILT